MKVHRRAFLETAGTAVLSLGVQTAGSGGLRPQGAEVSTSSSALLESAKLPFLHGREYFVMRSGRAKVAFQLDRADVGPAFTYMIFDAESAAQSGKKERAFNFDPDTGFTLSTTQVEVGGFSFTAFGENTEWGWAVVDGIPAVEVRWWAGGIRVTERIVALTGADALSRTILLEGLNLAGDESVYVRLCLPRGEVRSGQSRLVQTGKKYGSGIVVLGDVGARTDEQQGAITIGPLTVKARGRASLDILQFYQIPAQRTDALLARGSSLAAHVVEGRKKTQATWGLTSTLKTEDTILQQMYDKARFALAGLIADDGTMDNGMFQYGGQWVRDTAHSALGALHAGHFELAHSALEHVLTRQISDLGAAATGGKFDPQDQEELDQMGELLHALKCLRDWTGDDSLVRRNRKKLLALIQRSLSPDFRDATAMVHNRREFWERSFDDAYELAYQLMLILGLREAAELAPALGAEDQAERWRREADRTLQAILSHPTHSLVADGHFIKRRNVTGEVAEFAPWGQGSNPDVPEQTEKHNRLHPDATLALPMAYGLVDPRSPLALKTLDDLEQLWNMRWFGGGYERYNSTSQQDTPGPWPFASAFILRATHEAGLYDRSRRTLEWLNSVQGARTGFWFEEIPTLRSNVKWCGLISWTSGEVALFVVRHVLGIRFEGGSLVIRPALYPGSPPITADLRFRGGQFRLRIEGSGKVKHADLDGKKLKRRPDGSVLLPQDFASGTVRIRT